MLSRCPDRVAIHQEGVDMMEIVRDGRDASFRETKQTYYSPSLQTFYESSGTGEMRGGLPFRKEKFRATFLRAVEDLPLPFSCPHLKVAATLRELEDGEQGVRVRTKIGELCAPSLEEVGYVNPEGCIFGG